MTTVVSRLFYLLIAISFLSGCISVDERSAPVPSGADGADGAETAKLPSQEPERPDVGEQETELVTEDVGAPPEQPEPPEQIEQQGPPEQPEPPDQPEPPIEEPPTWSPPATQAALQPEREDEVAITGWLRTRDFSPEIAAFTRAPGGEQVTELLFRRYLNELINAAGIRGRGQPGGGAFRLAIAPTLWSEESEKNAYGAVDLRLTLAMEGAGNESVETVIHGPMTLSRVSHEDAQLNSLRSIPPEALRVAAETIRRELSAAIAATGLTYRVEERPTDTVEVYAVLRSLGVSTASSENVWVLFAPPPLLQERLDTLFAGSGYHFSIHPLTRTIRIIYNAEG